MKTHGRQVREMSAPYGSELPLVQELTPGVSAVPKIRRMARPKHGLDGKTWLQYSISVWNDLRKMASEKALRHPAIFPSALPSRLIQMFTRPGQWVLDPFAGSGATLIAARDLGRRAVGFEIARSYVEMYRERLKNEPLFPPKRIYEPIMHRVDCRKLGDYVKRREIQLSVTSPPYWDILTRDRTADGLAVRDYEGGNGDLGHVHNYEDFLETLENVFRGVYDVTVTGGYCCVVLMDIRKGNVYYPFHMDLTARLKAVGFVLDDIIIWDRRSEYNNLRPLGYPHVFRVNKVHEYILIMQRRGES